MNMIDTKNEVSTVDTDRAYDVYTIILTKGAWKGGIVIWAYKTTRRIESIRHKIFIPSRASKILEHGEVYYYDFDDPINYIKEHIKTIAQRELMAFQEKYDMYGASYTKIEDNLDKIDEIWS